MKQIAEELQREASPDDAFVFMELVSDSDSFVSSESRQLYNYYCEGAFSSYVSRSYQEWMGNPTDPTNFMNQLMLVQFPDALAEMMLVEWSAILAAAIYGNQLESTFCPDTFSGCNDRC